MKTYITELTQRELYVKVEKQAHSLRGNPFEYMVITGMCPVNVVELHAKKIQSLLTDQIGYKEEIAALRQRIAELESRTVTSYCDTDNHQFESLSNHKHHFINGTCVECLVKSE